MSRRLVARSAKPLEKLERTDRWATSGNAGGPYALDDQLVAPRDAGSGAGHPGDPVLREVGGDAELLEHALHEAAHLLPAQAPLSDFVHHNTLHYLQHLPFHEALEHAHRQRGVQTYLPLEAFHALWRKGDVRTEDLRACLAAHLGESAREPILGGATLYDAWWALLTVQLPPETEASIQWKAAEFGVFDAPRADLSAEALKRLFPSGTAPHAQREALSALYSESLALASEYGAAPEPHAFATHQELVALQSGVDPAALVNSVVVPFCAAFLDMGMAPWPMPRRELGLFGTWRAFALDHLEQLPAWLVQGVRRLEGTADPQDVVLRCLQDLGVQRHEWATYVERVLLELPGWAGMVHRLELNPGDRPEGAPPVTLLDYLAMRLVLSCGAIAHVARWSAARYQGSLAQLRPALRQLLARHNPRDTVINTAWRIYNVAQLLGVSAAELAAAAPAQRRQFTLTVQGVALSALQRVWQEAAERRYRDQILGALQSNRARQSAAARPAERLQVVVCIDDREESFRRHFEEQSADYGTYGAAGFFGVAVAYRGLDDDRHVSLCPVVVTPQHEVTEVADEEEEAVALARLRRRGLFAWIRAGFARGSRGLVMGALLAPLVGLVTTFPLVARLYFPRLSHRVAQRALRYALPAPKTRLSLHRDTDSRAASGRYAGFLLDEQVERVANLLENIGLVKDFGRIVAILGHGSVSVNNPHRAAYDCGACSGRHGGPNARLFATMANLPEVRAALVKRGIVIPEDCWFVGGFHNTGNDAVDWYDVHMVPAALKAHFEELERAVNVARARNAHERCRRFESAPRNPTPAQALAHVEERTVDLSQARPELGHATNAAAVVGRRALTRGLFLDRRSFLVSYDPTLDPTGAILERTLVAVGPVGAGINLEYYFSRVDNATFGCGTKLPHNLTGLFGVMDGSESDLRTGLPRQMIEIHDPLRLLLVVEASPATLLAIAGRQPLVRELVANEWLRLVSVHPESGEMQVFTPNGGFVPWDGSPEPLPTVSTSLQWYPGQLHNVPPALVEFPELRQQSQDKTPRRRYAA
jgi:hypothetical protein